MRARPILIPGAWRSAIHCGFWPKRASSRSSSSRADGCSPAWCGMTRDGSRGGARCPATPRIQSACGRWSRRCRRSCGRRSHPPRMRDAPEAIVGDLLGTFVDACARSFLADGLTGRGRRARRRSKRKLPLVDAWVAALTGRPGRGRCGRAGAGGARRGARRVAPGGGAVCRAPHVPDLFSPVRAGGTGGVAGGRASVRVR